MDSKKSTVGILCFSQRVKTHCKTPWPQQQKKSSVISSRSATLNQISLIALRDQQPLAGATKEAAAEKKITVLLTLMVSKQTFEGNE
jgi:hypothetical protein